MQIGILEPAGFSAAARATLARIGEVRAWNGEELGTFLAPLDALFVRLAHRIDGDLVRLAPKLRWICSPTTGHLHLDEAALAAHGVTVLSLRGERAFLESIRATPEHTFGLMLALLRRYKLAFSHVAAGGWDRDAFRGEELFGNRVGIVGMGRVGYRVAAYSTAFGAQVTWYDPADVPADPAWRRAPSVADAIEASRVVVLCASFEVGDVPVIGAAEIRRLRGRYLVNTARGELVDEPALLAAIEDGAIAGVAVDVIADENGTPRLEAWRTAAAGRNVIVTPHIGGATTEGMARTEQWMADKLVAAVAAAKATA